MSTVCHRTASANGKHVTSLSGSTLVSFSSLLAIVFCLFVFLLLFFVLFFAPNYQDCEKNTKNRAMVNPTIHLNSLAVIINNADMA